MIKTVIFDMGNVLIKFDPQIFLHRLGVSSKEEALLLRQVFRSIEWLQMDRGTLTAEAAIASICTRLPEKLHWAVERLVNHWSEPLIPMEGMEDLIKQLKAQGYRILLLSNAPRQQRSYWEQVPGSQYFDGTYISADYMCMKPEPAIYHDFLNRFDLKAEECVFIDDSPANIEASLFCGLPGIVFDGNMEELRSHLRALGVSC